MWPITLSSLAIDLRLGKHYPTNYLVTIYQNPIARFISLSFFKRLFPIFEIYRVSNIITHLYTFLDLKLKKICMP